ncbi:MAG: Hsp33 family molecular chaperone HslO [Verrucomicrobiales bacterium]
MMESAENALNQLETRSYFARGRNALVTRADFGPLYEDYYLHWLQHGIRFPTEADDVLKDALAALVLHLASRPQDETVAWTVNFPSPVLGLFVTGSTRPGNVVGRVWSEGVRATGCGLFCSETRAGNGQVRRSNVEFQDGDFFHAVEMYYAQSEQRPARLFRHGPEDFVMVSAQPECDLEWIASLDDDAIRDLDKNETLSLLETRAYHFDCGCTAERITGRLAALGRAGIDDLFAGDENIRVDCPRCGAVFDVTRQMFET